MARSSGWLLWRWLRALTGSAAATFGWLAIVTSAPFVLHGFAVYPEIPAALAVLVALAWRPGTADTRATSVVRGLALGALPWLGTKYAPMALVIAVLLAMRAPKDRARLAAIAAPAVVLVVAWLAWFAWLWGTPSPTAPYGTAHQMALWHLAAGLPGLFFDQEYGIAAVAPVLAMASVGWWRLWRRDAAGRTLVVETVLPLLALALTVGAFAMWWGGSAPPGRQLVAALPLLGVPLAALWQDLAEAPGASRAAGRPAWRGHRHDRHAGLRARGPAHRQRSRRHVGAAGVSGAGDAAHAASCRRSPPIARRWRGRSPCCSSGPASSRRSGGSPVA